MAFGGLANWFKKRLDDAGHAVQAVQRDVVQPIQRQVAQPARSVPENIGRQAVNIAHSPISAVSHVLGNANYDIAKAGVGLATGNTRAAGNAFKQFKQDYAPAVDIGRQWVARPAAQIGASLVKPNAQNNVSFHPGNRVEKFILGDKPVQSIQAGVRSNYQAHSSLPTAARIALATAYGAGQVANDLPVATGALKGVSKTVKVAAPDRVAQAFTKQPIPKDLLEQRMNASNSRLKAQDKGKPALAEHYGNQIDTLDKQIKQATRPPIVQKLSGTPLNQGGYVRIPRGTKDPAPDLSSEQKTFINDYANMLKGMGQGNGVSINPVTGARLSNNVRSAENKGKNMTEYDWFQQARNDLESGKAGFGASEDYAKIKPVTPESQNLLQVADQGQLNPKQPLGEVAAQPRGFILKETKPRNGRVDTVRISNSKDGLQATMQSESTPQRTLADSQMNVLNQPEVTAKLDKMGNPSPEVRPIASGLKTPKVEKAAHEDFMGSTNKWLADKQSANTNNILAVQQLPKMESGQSLGLIDQIQNGAETGNFAGLSGEIRAILEDRYNQLRDAGVQLGHLEDYFPQSGLWDKPEKVLQDYEALNLKGGFQNKRLIPTVAEGMQMGYKPKTTDYREILANYLNATDRVLANRRYFDDLKSKGLIAEAGQRPQGMQVIDAPGLPQPRAFIDPETGNSIQGNYYAHPTVAKELNKLFSPDIRGTGGKVLKAAANTSKGIQTLFLSGGVPHSAINAFGLAHWTKQSIAGHPLSATANLLRSFSETAAKKHEMANLDFIKKMESGEGGLPYRGTIDSKSLSSLTQRISNEKGLGKGKKFIDEAWNQIMEDGTFRRYLPALQLDTFKAVYLKQIKRGADEATAIQTAQQATRQAFGINSMAKDALRSKYGNDVLSTFFFAPKYRESMVNFWKDNVKSLGHPTSPKYRENLKFMAGATVLFGAMQAANEALNGHPTWDNENPNDRFNLSIPTGDGKSVAIPFLSSIATVPRIGINATVDLATGNPKAAGMELKKFGSQLVRPPIDLLTNQKYNGRQVYNPKDSTSQKFKDQASYMVGQYNHPWIQAGINVANKTTSGPLETLATATEMPLRFRNYSSKRDGTSSSTQAVEQQMTSPEEKKFLAMSPQEQKNAANQSDSGYKMYQKKLDIEKQNATDTVLPRGMSKTDEQTLHKVQKMTDQQKEDYFYKDKSAEYAYKVAQYERDKKLGKISTKDRIKKDDEMKKLKVGTQFNKESRDLWSLSKDDLWNYLSTEEKGKDKQKIADEIIAYDDALTKSGVQKKNKFRDKYGNITLKPKDTTGGGGRKGRKGAALASISLGRPNGPRANVVKVSTGGAPSAKLAVPKGVRVGKAKVGRVGGGKIRRVNV